jgi:predicted DNA-binding transcriptional regulator AlpA
MVQPALPHSVCACAEPAPLTRSARRARRAEALASIPDPLLTAMEAATETGRARSAFWRDVKRGLLPAPYYVTPRCPRWRRSGCWLSSIRHHAPPGASEPVSHGLPSPNVSPLPENKTAGHSGTRRLAIRILWQRLFLRSVSTAFTAFALGRATRICVMQNPTLPCPELRCTACGQFDTACATQNGQVGCYSCGIQHQCLSPSTLAIHDRLPHHDILSAHVADWISLPSTKRPWLAGPKLWSAFSPAAKPSPMNGTLAASAANPAAACWPQSSPRTPLRSARSVIAEPCG